MIFIQAAALYLLIGMVLAHQAHRHPLREPVILLRQMDAMESTPDFIRSELDKGSSQYYQGFGLSYIWVWPVYITGLLVAGIIYLPIHLYKLIK